MEVQWDLKVTPPHNNSENPPGEKHEGRTWVKIDQHPLKGQRRRVSSKTVEFKEGKLEIKIPDPVETVEIKEQKCEIKIPDPEVETVEIKEQKREIKIPSPEVLEKLRNDLQAIIDELNITSKNTHDHPLDL